MKHLTQLTIFLGLALSVTAHANFTGLWSGTGKARDNKGTSTDCTEIIFNLTQTDTSFKINSGSWTCGAAATTFKAEDIEVRKDQLWFMGKEVGFIDDTTFYMTWTSTFQYIYEITHLSLRKVRFIESMLLGSSYFIVEGDLTKKDAPNLGSDSY